VWGGRAIHHCGRWRKEGNALYLNKKVRKTEKKHTTGEGVGWKIQTDKETKQKGVQRIFLCWGGEGKGISQKFHHIITWTAGGGRGLVGLLVGTDAAFRGLT